MGFYGLAAALAAVLCIASGAIGYSKGSASRNDEVSALSAAIKASEIVAKEATDRAEKAAARVVIQYRDKVRIVREVTPGEIQLVEVIKRDATCELPGSFRVLHDRAASGGKETEAPAGTDAAPVPAEVAAQTVAENYRIARENAARLEALQALITEQ